MSDKKYYEWWGDLDAVSIRFPARHFGQWWMVEGRPVVGWQESLLATYTSEEVLASNFGLARNSWPVASEPMRAFLEATIPGLIQFLPFCLRRPDGSAELHGYCVCQILRLVVCLDRDRTKVRNNWVPVNSWGDFGTYLPIVLDSSLIRDERLFRIKGMCHSIVVREDIKHAIESAGFAGQRFDLLETSN